MIPELEDMENRTALLPEFLASLVIREAEVYFQVELPKIWSVQLANRAALCFARNEQYRRRVSGAQGREWVKVFYRHWLPSKLKRAHTDLLFRLPESFYCEGKPLEASERS